MRARTFVALAAAVAVTAGMVWLTGRQPPPPPPAAPGPAGAEARIFAQAPLDLEGIGIEAGDISAEMARGPDGWMLTRPLRAPASPTLASRWASLLEDLRRRDTITAAQRSERKLELADYGLDRPRATISLAWGGASRVVLLGHEAPLGGTVYVRFSDSDDVIATDGAITNLIPPSVQALRDRALLRGEMDRVSKIEVRRKGAAFVQLALSDTGWRLQQPIASQADPSEVNALLKALFGMRTMSFVKDSPFDATAAGGDDVPPEAWLEPYGLAADDADVRVTVWDAGVETGRELVFGKEAPDHSVYARNRDIASVVNVSSSSVARLFVSADLLRERRVFPINPSDVESIAIRRRAAGLVMQRGRSLGWRITEPAQWDAEPAAVKNLLNSLAAWRSVAFHDGAATNLAAFGLDTPGYTFEAVAGQPSDPERGDKQPERPARRLDVGGVSAARTVYVRADGGDSVSEVPLHSISALGENPADPLLYRSRTILAVQPDHILAITLEKFGRKQSVNRQPDGSWRVAEPAGRAVNTQAIANVLLGAANLRAIRIHPRSMERIASSGLDRPQALLTFTLDGEGGIQKTLVIGGPSRADGVFAMVRGMDCVFVAASSDAELITRDITAEPFPGARP